jgi:phosphohistidine phosphatase
VNQGRRLFLLRHAKSSWKDASLRDEERPLAKRGQQAAAVLQQHLRASDVGVDLVLCSPARRTRETWAGICGGLHPDPDVRIVAAVYEATSSELLELLRDVTPSVGSVLIIGHNPGIETLAAELISGGKTTALARLREGFVTGGFATLSVDSAWADLDRGGANLEDYLRPRERYGG